MLGATKALANIRGNQAFLVSNKYSLDTNYLSMETDRKNRKV